MASKSLSGLTGTKENRQQGPENEIKAGNSSIHQGLRISYDGPKNHVELLDFYFGHPTSTDKSYGAPGQSKW